MEYERISSLIEKFKNDKYILKAYNKLYDYNNCKNYRNIKIADIENGDYFDKIGCSEIEENSCGHKDGIHNKKKDELKDIIEIINQTLYTYTNETLNKFSENNRELVDTYNKIDNCNHLCYDIDAILSKHKNDIKFISNDINDIQELTENMNDKLSNRKLTLELLNTYIKIILITPKLIYDICNGDINENFIKNINILTKKIENCKHCLYDSYPSIKFSYIELEKLKYKAIDRIYTFFLQKINDIKNKKLNIHLIQQNLIKFHELNAFLYNNNRNVYNYLIKEYITIMNRTYHNLFKNYVGNLEKKKIEFTNELTIGFSSYKNDNNVTLLSAKNKMMNIFGFNLNINSNNNSKNEKKENLFSLNDRNKILNDLDYYSNLNLQKTNLPIIFTTDNAQYYFEEIYKSINKLFLDTGTAEYLFILKFFKNYENPDFLFLEIYSKTISLCFDFIYYYMNNTFDFISLFCIYMINLQNKVTIRNRNIISLYEFIDKIQNLIWKKILFIIDQNIISLDYRNHSMNEVTKNCNKKNIYNLIYTNNFNNANKNYNTEGNYDKNNNFLSNIQLNNDLDEGEKNIVQNFQDINNYNEVTKNNSINVGNDIERNQMNNSSTCTKTQTHYITRKFSDFYCSFTILNDLCFKLEKYYIDKSYEKQSSNKLNNNEGASDSNNSRNVNHNNNSETVNNNNNENVNNNNSENVNNNNNSENVNNDNSENVNNNNNNSENVNNNNSGNVNNNNNNNGNILHLDKKKEIKDSLKGGFLNICENVSNKNYDSSLHQCEKNENEEIYNEKANNDKKHGNINKSDMLCLKKSNDIRKNLNIDNCSKGNVTDRSTVNYSKNNNSINDDNLNIDDDARFCDNSNDDNNLFVKKSNGLKNVPISSKKINKKNSEVASYELYENRIDDFALKYKNLDNFLFKLEETIVDALINLSNELSCKKDKLLFLINNYYHIISILKENEVNEEKIVKFQNLLEKEISIYIDHQLNEYIKEIILFVNKHEQIINNLKEEDNNIMPHIDIKIMESIAVTFSKEWKSLLKEIKQNVIQSFIHFDNSLNILKLLNTKILLHYTRYYQLIKKIFYNSQVPTYIQNLPSVDVVLAQIKKNTKNVDT